MKSSFVLTAFVIALVSGAASASHHEKKNHNHHGKQSHGHSKHHDFSDAKKWAKVFDDPKRAVWQKPEEVIRKMQLKPGMMVADIGAGTGYFLPYLSKAVAPRGMIFALDIETSLVKHMNERIVQSRMRNVYAKTILMDDPLLEAGSQDRILIVDTWHHIEGRISYAKKLREALKENGELHIVDFEPSSKRGPKEKMTSVSIMNELKAAGFSVKQLKETLPDQYIIVGVRK